MIDQVPWILALVVAALAMGFFLGRKTPLAGPASSPSAAATRHPQQASAPQAAARRADDPAPSPAQSSSAIPALASARTWAYQLQDLDLDRLAASPVDLLVIDATKDGSDRTALKPADLRRLQVKPDGSRRLVAGYCSIGEAESYRSYWHKSWMRDSPAWLLGENPEWEENFAVRFWDPGWQNIVFGTTVSLVDRMIEQGFDGIYLDKCDVTEDLREHFAPVARSRPDLDGDMVTFVQRISSHSRKQRPGFFIIMQNAEILLRRPELRAAIDGVAKEELLFGLDGAETANDRDDVEDACHLLDTLKAEGKPVFVVEYLETGAKIVEAAQRTKDLGYRLYVAPKDRELDRLSVKT